MCQPELANPTYAVKLQSFPFAVYLKFSVCKKKELFKTCSFIIILLASPAQLGLWEKNNDKRPFSDSQLILFCHNQFNPDNYISPFDTY